MTRSPPQSEPKASGAASKGWGGWRTPRGLVPRSEPQASGAASKGWGGWRTPRGPVPRSEPQTSGATAFALAFSLLLLARALPWPPAPERPVGTPPQHGAARLLWGLPLDLNHEAAHALEALPGIGPGRARAIVASRPFCALADLDRVAGIGPVTLRRLTGRVYVEPVSACLRAAGD